MRQTVINCGGDSRFFAGAKALIEGAWEWQIGDMHITQDTDRTGGAVLTLINGGGWADAEFTFPLPSLIAAAEGEISCLFFASRRQYHRTLDQ